MQVHAKSVGDKTINNGKEHTNIHLKMFMTKKCKIFILVSLEYFFLDKKKKIIQYETQSRNFHFLLLAHQ